MNPSFRKSRNFMMTEVEQPCRSARMDIHSACTRTVLDTKDKLSLDFQRNQICIICKLTNFSSCLTDDVASS